MEFVKEKKVLIEILDALGFECISEDKYEDIWKHKERNIITDLTHMPNDNEWINKKKIEISKFVSTSFSIEEVKSMLQPFINKRKINFTKDGRVGLLGVSKESLLKEQKIYQKDQDDWRKILNELPTDLDFEGELLVLLLNKGDPKNYEKIYGNGNPNDIDGFEFKKIDKETKRNNKEELNKLKKKKKVLEDRLLKEIRKLTEGEK